MVILSKNKVRQTIAGLGDYWAKPGAALTAAQTALWDAGFTVQFPSFNCHDRCAHHTQSFALMTTEGKQVETRLLLSWHWMSSGNQCEVVMYLT